MAICSLAIWQDSNKQEGNQYLLFFLIINEKKVKNTNVLLNKKIVEKFYFLFNILPVFIIFRAL